MQIHISPRDIKLTAPIQSFVEDRINSLKTLESDLIGAHVTICHDEKRAPKHAFVIKVHLELSGPDIHAEDHGHELYPAIDIVTARLAEQLRHRKSKRVRGNREKSRKEKEKRQAMAIA